MATEKPRIIMHVDIDSFYPSVEVKQNPSLKGFPVIVGADPKEGKGRGVVVSCSYEGRKFGIHSGQPISRAYRLCPDAIYLRPNFLLYGRASSSVMRVLRSFADKFEQVSIDEAFLDVTSRVADYQEAESLALKIKQELHRSEGFTCSIGIAPNKSSAKIAAEFQKPDGLTVVEPERVKDFLAPLPVSAITGVGKKTQIFLKSLGVETIGQLQNIPGKDLVKYFGKGGVWLWGVSHGLEKIDVKERVMMKSLSAEHTFEYDIDDKAKVLATTESLADELHRRVASANLLFKTVAIKVRFRGFETHTRENSLPNYTNQKGILLQEVKNLFREFEHDRRKIRLIGLRVSNIKKDIERKGLEVWLRG